MTQRPAGWWTLEELAAAMDMQAASLRQRAARGTLPGAKRVGGVQRGLWVVPDKAAQALIAEGRRRPAKAEYTDEQVAEIDARARAIVANPKRRRMPRGVNQHGGAA